LPLVDSVDADTCLEIGTINGMGDTCIEGEGGVWGIMNSQREGGGRLVVLRADNLAIVVKDVALDNTD
jgi:hypothetical protein